MTHPQPGPVGHRDPRGEAQAAPGRVGVGSAGEEMHQVLLG